MKKSQYLMYFLISAALYFVIYQIFLFADQLFLADFISNLWIHLFVHGFVLIALIPLLTYWLTQKFFGRLIK